MLISRRLPYTPSHEVRLRAPGVARLGARAVDPRKTAHAREILSRLATTGKSAESWDAAESTFFALAGVMVAVGFAPTLVVAALRDTIPEIALVLFAAFMTAAFLVFLAGVLSALRADRLERRMSQLEVELTTLTKDIIPMREFILEPGDEPSDELAWEIAEASETALIWEKQARTASGDTEAFRGKTLTKGQRAEKDVLTDKAQRAQRRREQALQQIADMLESVNQEDAVP